MRKPDYKIGVMLEAVRANIEPEVYDDVAAWDDDSYGVAAGLLLKKSDAGYKVLCYYDEPQVFIWQYAVKIEETR